MMINPLTLPLKLRTQASGNFQPFQLGFGRPKVGSPDVVEIADRTDIRRASSRDASTRSVCSEAALADPPWPLADVDANKWRGLAERAIEPNGYYLPDWELAV